jgi:hypothetical protein
MTAGQPPAAREPQNPPSLADLAERDQYAVVAAGSAEAVRGSAKTWETALTAFITLITAGVIIKGRDSTDGLSIAWRLPIVVLAGGGLLLAVAGLWLTVAAEAGTHPETKTLQEIRATHGTLSAYQVYLAVQAALRLRWGIRLAAAAMTMLIAGVIATLLAPGPAAQSTYVTVTHGQSITCGTPEPAPAGQIRIAVPGESEPAVIKAAQITAITLTESCR